MHGNFWLRLIELQSKLSWLLVELASECKLKISIFWVKTKKCYPSINEILSLRSCDNISANNLNFRVVLLDVSDHILKLFWKESQKLETVCSRIQRQYNTTFCHNRRGSK